MPGRSAWRELRIRKEGTSAKIVEAKETAKGTARAEERIGFGHRSPERIAAGKRAMRVLHME